MIELHWYKSKTGTWLRLMDVNLENETDFGVYIIWHSGQPSRVVRIGQGDIADRLAAHRTNPAVTAYLAKGDLLVTWAVVPPRLVDGVERYLAEYWKPLIGDRFPNVAPIEVNSPF